MRIVIVICIRNLYKKYREPNVVLVQIDNVAIMVLDLEVYN